MFEETIFLPCAASPLDDHTTLRLIFQNYLHKMLLPSLDRRREGAVYHHLEVVVRI